MAGIPGIRGDVRVGEGPDTPNETVDAHKALFGDVRPWKYRSGWDIEAEYVSALGEAKGTRDEYLFGLITYVSELPQRVDGLAAQLKAIEQGVGKSGARLRWQGWLGNPHSAVYLMEPEGETGAKEVSMGNLFNNEQARARLRAVIGRNRAVQYLALLDEYDRIKARVVREIKSSSHDFKFKVDRTKHPVEQWANSVGPFWEALVSSTKQNIDRYLELDDQANEIAFEFNFDRQPIRWRTIVLRPEVKVSDPMGPSFPHFRVVTNIDRKTGKRQTKAIEDYKRDLILKAVARELKAALGRAPERAEVLAERAKARKRACSMWITEELLAHCKLGKHTTKINRLQKRLQDIHPEWSELRERLTRLSS
ncbi:hypothetical protein SAMN05216178_7027 [Pseudomonas saponiphila]|jgi:hypothetical protein|uniref:Uncharacterized protein n=1 Tax=Pseudomonas saponiphila TaxID=556534 RepID=A0A1H5A8K6_9PSED|nr:hypothetical protein [Pseudomonas saponiphila]SED38415.1 hypothetical protein SAMN05216178_7027 [Pseudomonas saponiphila]